MKQIMNVYSSFADFMSIGLSSILTLVAGIVLVWYLFGFYFQKANLLKGGKNTKLLK